MQCFNTYEYHFSSKHLAGCLTWKTWISNPYIKLMENNWKNSSMTLKWINRFEIVITLKSLGPNEDNFGNDIKMEIMWFRHEFHSMERFVKCLKCTFIVLILKKENPQKFNEIIHISLVGCVYKVLAKVLEIIL